MTRRMKKVKENVRNLEEEEMEKKTNPLWSAALGWL